MCSCLGEIQALNAFAADLIAHDEDYERAADVLTHAISELSTGSLLVEPTPLPPSSSLEQPREFKRARSVTACSPNSSQMEVYLLDTVGTFGSECRSSSISFSYHEHQDCSWFVRRCCMFECICCNQLQSSKIPCNDTDAQQTLLCCSSGVWVSPQKYCTVAITCLYNLALCHHLQWYDLQHREPRRDQRSSYASSNGEIMHNADHTLQHLVRALEQYELAFGAGFGVGASASFGMLFEALDPIWHILMAICANAAHCAMELGQLSKVHVWNARLCNALQHTSDVHSPTRPSSSSSSSSCRMDDCDDFDDDDDDNCDDGGSDDDGFDDDDDSTETSSFFQRFTTREYRTFLWHCAFRNRVSGTGAGAA